MALYKCFIIIIIIIVHVFKRVITCVDPHLSVAYFTVAVRRRHLHACVVSHTGPYVVIFPTSKSDPSASHCCGHPLPIHRLICHKASV